MKLSLDKGFCKPGLAFTHDCKFVNNDEITCRLCDDFIGGSEEYNDHVCGHFRGNPDSMF